MTIVCILLERFELAVAAGGRAGLLGEPAALAPESGRELFIGAVSQAAEAYGIHAGMRMGEALSRCPRLALVPPDPMGVAEAWERALGRLESLGAAVESLRPGEACFDARGLERLHAGRVVRMLADGYLAAQGSERLRRLLAGPRIGQGPTRFCAMVAASAARVRRPARIAGAADLAGHPVELLRRRPETAALVEPLERLGIARLGELAALPRGAVADRFGRPGLLAHDLARGHDTPLQPRLPGELLREELELPESGSGEQLGRALGLLIDRLLARRERRGRTLRAVDARGAARRGRHVARARRLPRGARRRGADADGARQPPGAAARAGRDARADDRALRPAAPRGPRAVRRRRGAPRGAPPRGRPPGPRRRRARRGAARPGDRPRLARARAPRRADPVRVPNDPGINRGGGGGDRS